MGFWGRLKEGLSKTRQNLAGKIEDLIAASRNIEEPFYEELEEILIQADVSAQIAMDLVEQVKKSVRENKIRDPQQVKQILQQEVKRLLDEEGAPLCVDGYQPAVILVVGVNGVGKTTTIAKLSHLFREQGKKVLIGAADTFRAAAAEQLEIWAGRTGVDLVRHGEGADPAAVAYDALKAAVSRRADVLIVDTAGRLHTKTNLMEELKKIARVLGREYPGAPHEVLLVLDATTGQNAISQAKLFKEAVKVTGIVLTKLDSTAKGGVVVCVSRELGIPVKFIGIGEGMEDLRPFDGQEYVEALFG